MWTVAKIKADYEGWWLFSDWTDKIIEQYQFTSYDEMLNYYKNIISKSKDYYDNYVVGKYNIHAFYNNCDLNFCEDCEEDLQIFYSFIVLNNKEVYYNLPKIN
ncbi:regulatory protein MsaA [Staphylococcus haemolyticus]|uniref:regulatory protein MsaA n=1 Tax=Staphylococcus haemolyticus TaxID=1283 RepID=UPI00069F7415|nr:regulatory protein MsaA [Staphylococcus haemolyticus]SIJ55640.1 Uncharacterized protein conserved in bacteria [Mycobacteroides abscessus subsp. abscessus]MBE7356322.1 DUF1033 family protein [Staphylococcus haemolyticus]MCH4459569.1 regulatory protein MsaA [Staphylococcus haemolyticus]MCH4483005.1 regulatory protein MsaA [Staphylococcus haemolyticus]MCH4532207.1 regulatory protein MsaA [Staphylococcus haemolyticus]